MPLSRLLNSDQGAHEHFHVPKYQREYTWGRSEWEQFLQDLEENPPGYFMGSIICVIERQDSLVGDEAIYEVVDGQQRLTTLTIVLMAIFKKLKEALPSYDAADEDDAEDLKGLLDALKRKILKRKVDARRGEPGGFTSGRNTYFLRVQPSAQNHNLEDYRYVLTEADILPGQARPRYCGNRSMMRAFVYFRDKLPSDVPGLRELVNKISLLQFVQITVGTQSDAFTLFESLNNRGVPLSAIDIIKNKLLAEMERQHGVDIDESFDRWQSIIRALPDVAEQERFLRHYYNAFKHKPEVRVERVPRATRSHFIRVYETLIKRNAETTFRELTVTAKIYGDLLRPHESFQPDLAKGLVELERIGAASAYQILLYLWTLAPDVLQPQGFLTSAVDLLCRYHIRRNVTDMPPTRDLDPAAIDVVEACASHVLEHGSLHFDKFVDVFLRSRHQPASRDQFRAALEGPIYQQNVGMARYLLVQLDLLHHTREYLPDFWTRDQHPQYPRLVWTIEHVLPQTDKLPQHWVDMLADGDANRAAAIQAESVHRLGNLTLSGYNSDLATSSFEKKQLLARDRSFLGHRINIGYNNGLALNKLTFELGGLSWSLATAPRWSTEMIAARTVAMVEPLLDANSLPCDG